MRKWLISLVFMTGCATLVKSAQEPFDGGVQPPFVSLGGHTGDGRPWARVTNGLPYAVTVKVECPELMLFQLPARTSQRFFVTPLPQELDPGTCHVTSWKQTNKLP